MTGDVEAAAHFFQAYFHQDWHLFSVNAAGLVKGFLAEQPPARVVAQVIRGIREILRTHADADLDAVLVSVLGCEMLPSHDGLSARAFLERIAMQLEDAAARAAVD